MPLPVYVKCGVGDNAASVSSDNSLNVTIFPSNPNDLSREIVQRRHLYRQQFTESGGGTDMDVDGSSTAQLFKVSAVATGIVYVLGVRFYIEGTQWDVDQSGELRRFGAAAASPGLTNGVLLDVVQQETTTHIFNSAGVKNMGDFMRYVGGGQTPMASGFLNFKNGIATGEDIFNVEVRFEAPVALYPGTLDYIGITIRDDLTAIDSFTAFAIGYEDRL